MIIKERKSHNENHGHSLVLIGDKTLLPELINILTSFKINCYSPSSLDEAVSMSRNNPQITSAYIQAGEHIPSLFEAIYELKKANPRLKFVAVVDEDYANTIKLTNGFDRVISPPFEPSDIFDCQPI